MANQTFNNFREVITYLEEAPITRNGQIVFFNDAELMLTKQYVLMAKGNGEALTKRVVKACAIRAIKDLQD
jgi:hypothetical protein